MVFPSAALHSLPEIIEWVESTRAVWRERHDRRRPAVQPWVAPWFRGVSSPTHGLVPSLYRREVSWEWRDPLVGEIDLRRDFARRARPYLDLRSGPLRSPFEFYFAMQHYGMCTRLLDWTESALVAVYFATRRFALREDRAPTDVCLWMLDPLVMNDVTAEVGYRMLDIEHPALQRYLPSPQYGRQVAPPPEPPAALVATSPTDRVAVQRGAFTIHGGLQLGIEDFEHAQLYLQKAVVRGNDVHDLCEDLRVAGVSEVSVFPDLDGLAKEIRARTAGGRLVRG